MAEEPPLYLRIKRIEEAQEERCARDLAVIALQLARVEEKVVKIRRERPWLPLPK